MNYKAINTWRGFGDIIINHEKDARLVSNVTRTSRYIYNLVHTPAVLGGNSPLATCSPFPLVPGGVRHVCQEWNRSPCVVQFKDPITKWKYNLKKKKKEGNIPSWPPPGSLMSCSAPENEASERKTGKVQRGSWCVSERFVHSCIIFSLFITGETKQPRPRCSGPRFLESAG